MTTLVRARLSRRAWLAAGISAAVLALAVVAGLRVAPAAPGPVMVVERLSALLSGMFLSLGAAAPLGYAFVAGMVAAVNPCGIVLLPAYLGYYLETDPHETNNRRAARLRRALLISATMTASFAALFVLAGLLAKAGAVALASALPWIGLGVGALLILLGGVAGAGWELSLSLAPRAAGRLKGAAQFRGLGGYAAYGVAYALASLGCTLPLFLGVVGTSLSPHGPAGTVGQFLLFALGLGTVLTVLVLGTVWLGDGLIKRARRLGRHIGWTSAVLLWLAGAYIVYYWLTALTLL